MSCSWRLPALTLLLAIALTAALLICCTPIGVGSDDDDDVVESPPPGLGDPGGDGAAIFGYAQCQEDDDCSDDDDDQDFYFTQYVDSQMGDELDVGQWSTKHYWQYMTMFSVGGEQYIMGHSAYNTFDGRSDQAYFIQKIYSTGDMGPQTDNGSWANTYATLVGAEAGNNTFIFGQNHSSNYWFIQQVLPGGTLGKEIQTGFFSDTYPVAVPLEMGDHTYIYFQSDKYETGHSGHYYWFIAELTEDGHLHQTDDGYWTYYYSACTALEVDGNWYIYGQDSDSNYMFIQNVTDKGKMGSQTANGHWNYYYNTITSYKALDGNTYLFGQAKGNKHWFIQQVTSGGKLGNQTADGSWDYYYAYVFPFAIDTSYVFVDRWMSLIYDTISDRKLIDITFPGSHDAGVNEKDYDSSNCWGEARSCNTTAQLTDIAGQLADGSRYFDIRPTIKEDSSNWDNWRTGHFNDDMSRGCQGEKMADVFNDVKEFFADLDHANELVILKLSHCLNKERGGDCNSDDLSHLTTVINLELGDILVKCDDCNLMHMTLADILEKGNVIALVQGVASDKANGIFSWSANDLPIYDDYANSDDLDTMISDQTSKLRTWDNHSNQLFLLSWTLTMTTGDAIDCLVDGKSITDMAEEAKAALFSNIDDMLQNGIISQTIYPNIVYIDAFENRGTRAAIYLNMWDRHVALWESGTSGFPGAYSVMQEDGNFVIYWPKGSPTPIPLWASGTAGHEYAYYMMQGDGNFVIYDVDKTALWSTHTAGHPGAYNVMQGDGNFVIYTEPWTR